MNCPPPLLGEKSGPLTNRKHKLIATKTIKRFGVIDILHEDVAHCAVRATEIVSGRAMCAAFTTDVRSYVKTF